MGEFESIPHGLITVIKMQNMNLTRNIDLARIIVPFQTVYTLDGKILLSSVLNSIDSNNDGILELREIIVFILHKLKLWNVNLPLNVQQNIDDYLNLLDSSVNALLTKYELKTMSERKRQKIFNF